MASIKKTQQQKNEKRKRLLKKPAVSRQTPRTFQREPAVKDQYVTGPWEWAVGVTTAPRLCDTLKRTLEGLQSAGWDRWHLFCDGTTVEGANVTCRQPKVGAFLNWRDGLNELLSGNPEATALLMVQDDVVFSRNVKDYLDRLPVPLGASCLKLYASGVVEPDLPLHYGFHGVPQITSSCDAQAIMFTREQAVSLLTDQTFLDHQFCDRGYANIDGAIFKSSVARGRTQYIHRPSLCQHIGVTSSLDHEWRHESMSQCFYGEDFDCDSLTDIAIVGYDTYSGLGYLNRDASANLRCHWCVTEHPRFQNFQKTWPCDFDSEPPKDLVDFLQTFTTVLCFEKPYWRKLPELIGNCVLVPMYEWFPPTGWDGVRHYVCPTRQCYEFVKSCGHSCAYLKWPIDTSRFPFRQRDVCERFVFSHGTGGHSDRKGALILSEAAKMVPHIPLTVFTQTKRATSGHSKAVTWPRHVDVHDQVRDPNDIYTAGDVLLYPSRFEGLGLPQLEAMSTGMPVISSDVAPVNEHPAWKRFQTFERETFTVRHRFDTMVTTPEEIASKMKLCYGQPIVAASREARQYAESISWQNNANEVRNLLCLWKRT